MVDHQTDISRGANEDVIATAVGCRGEMITGIITIYEQKNMHSGERQGRMMNWQRVIQQRSTILVRDYNTHSIQWNPRCQVQRNAAFWEDVIDQNGLEIGDNGEATHHWTRDGHEGEWVIDLMPANRTITN